MNLKNESMVGGRIEGGLSLGAKESIASIVIEDALKRFKSLRSFGVQERIVR
jgi:hypothetical protein